MKLFNLLTLLASFFSLYFWYKTYFNYQELRKSVLKKAYHKKDDPGKNTLLFQIIYCHLQNEFDVDRDKLYYISHAIHNTIITKLEANELIEINTTESYEQKQLRIYEEKKLGMFDYPPENYFIYKDLIENGELEPKTKKFYLNAMKQMQKSLPRRP